MKVTKLNFEKTQYAFKLLKCLVGDLEQIRDFDSQKDLDRFTNKLDSYLKDMLYEYMRYDSK